ncbi:MAG TPA: hypothetical protein VIT93_06300, partial [Dehalococcoidia bacterium]
MYLRSIVAVSAGLAICLIMTGLAATIASARPSMGRLDADVDSALHADYSKDAQNVRFVPIDPEIIEDARDDEERVTPPEPEAPGAGIADDDVELVPVFR